MVSKLGVIVLAIGAVPLSAQYLINTFAGNGTASFSGDGGPALSAGIGVPLATAADALGNVYIVDNANLRIRTVDSNGIITTLAGNGSNTDSGDGGPAVSAGLNGPFAVAADSAGNVYVSTGGNRIRKIANGIITTFAGNGTAAYTGDNGPATSASLNGPHGIAVDAAGSLYIADDLNFVIRKVSNGIITTIAGTGASGFSGDNGPATSAKLNFPNSVAVGGGNIYISDYANNRIRKIDSNGIITTVAGNGSSGYSGDGGPATSATMNSPTGVAVDSAGNLFIADAAIASIREVSGGVINTIVGTGSGGFSGDGGPSINAVCFCQSVTVDSTGRIFIADGSSNRVRILGPNLLVPYIIQTIAGNGQHDFTGDGGPATSAALYSPRGMAFDSGGNLIFSDYGNSRVRKIDQNGIITTIAGNGVNADGGDGGAPLNASIGQPSGLAIDAAGNIYVANYTNSRIRKISNGVITTVAGTGAAGFSGDNGPATSAKIALPQGIAVDGNGTLYIADEYNNRIRKVTNGTITTLAGGGNSLGDGGPATSAQLNQPWGVAANGGNVFIADAGNNRIRKVDSNGMITTIAGTGIAGFSGDGGPATSAQLSYPTGVAVDAIGNIYIAGFGDSRVRKITNGTITTVAGTGLAGYNGDGIPATLAQLNHPTGFLLDSAGVVRVAEDNNNRIRILTPTPPNLISLTPRSAPAGSADLTITINGTGFLFGAVAQYNGASLPTTFVSFTQLKATVSVSLLSAAGPATVTVARSNALVFNVLSPAINSLNPASVSPGASQFTLTVNGANFVNSSVVQFGSTALTTSFVNSTQLTATVPANLVAAAGNASVTVVSASATSNALTFVIGTPALSCTASYPQTPQFRFEGVGEQFGNVVLTCTGGTAGQNVNATVSVTSNVNLTSRILNNSTQATEALLIVGNPAPAQQALNANIFQGVLTNSNTITFSSVPIPAPGSSGQTILTIANLRGNVHQLGQFSSKAPPFVSLTLAMSGGITLNNPQYNAGFPPPVIFQIGAKVSSAGTQRTVPISFTEGFATAFKTRVASGGQQNSVSAVYNTESGFVNTSLLPTAGLADSATRLIVQFANVPAGVNVYVSVFPDGNTNAQLVSTDANGAGATSFVAGSSQFGGTYAQVSTNTGVGAAVWEITSADPNSIETLQFHVVLTGATQPDLGSITMAGSFAPLTTISSASAVAPVPRFAGDSISNFVNLTVSSNSAAASVYGTLALPGYHPSELRLRAAATPNVQVGSNLSFVYNLANNGPGPAPQTSVASNLPPALSYTSCAISGGGVCAAEVNPDGSTTVVGEIGTPLQPGQAPSFYINAQVASGVGTTVTVPAVLGSGMTDSAPDDNVILTSFAVSSSAPPPVTVSFPSNPPGLQVQVGSNAAQANPSVSVGQSATVSFTAPTPQAGPPGIQYVFNSWSDGVTQAAHPAMTPPIGGGSITAIFDTQYQITATASTGGTINLSPSSTGNFYRVNSAVQIAAAPASGYVFAGFTGDVTGNNNPATVVMPAKPLSVRANFVPALLTLSPGAVNFGATPGATLVTSGQSINVAVPPGSNWTVSANQAFISVMPASGMGNGSFTISMVASKVPASGSASGMVSVTASGVGNSPQMVTVNVAVAPSTQPFGSFDTPTDGTTGVAGAIPVTGWSLDSIEITKVDIWREPVTNEPAGGGPNGLVYIGDAVLVTGARPDVQAANPNTPLNYRAGWGYLMLTNFLPNSAGTGALGNGTYKLHAIAHNTAGALLDLGTKTLTVNNAQASKPFGTIDTPTQGGTISGSQFVNFGWALTQNPNCVPNDGSTLTVYIDGQALPGHPVYNNKRNDIATLFPGLCNSNGAIGYYIIDTTQLTNGVHTIFWIAFDDHNRGDGLGSRYFNAFNTGTSATAQPPPDDAIDPPDPRYASGTITIEAEELDRLELPLGAKSGYMQTPAGRAPLPIGSSLKRGTFYWHLGPGFTSTYSLVFQRPDGSAITIQVRVR